MISRFLVPIVALALAVGATVAVINQVEGDDKYVIYATFDDAAGMLKNYNVKIGGVPAGTVEDIDLDEQDNAVIRMELDEEAAPIGAGATAKVRPVNLLGETYIDLDPGDLSKPLPSGSSMPKESTDIPVELDDALNTLDPDTRGAMRILINEAGIAMAGRGADFNAVLEELPPAIDEAEKVVEEVASENAALERAVVSGDRVVAAVAEGSEDFGELIESAADALETVAERRAELGETVRGAPGTLAALRSTLTQLDGAAQQLTPAARDLRRTTPALARTLTRAPEFAKDAEATLKTATRISPSLSKLGKQSTPTLRELGPTAENLATFVSDTGPLVDALDRRKGLREVVEFMHTWSNAIRGRDGLGHHFRIHITFDEEIITSALSRYAGINLPAIGPKPPAAGAEETSNDPPPAQPRTPERPAPAPAEPKPAQPKKPVKPLLDGVTKGLQEIGKPVEEAVGGLTGALEKGLNDGLAKGANGLLDPGRKSGAAGQSDTSKLFNYLLGP